MPGAVQRTSQHQAWKGCARGGKVSLTSFQQETDALRVVDLDAVAAGQGVQQRCLACNGASSQSDEDRVTPQKAGRKTTHPTNQTAKPGQKQPFPIQQAPAVPVMVHSCGDSVTGPACRAGGSPTAHVCHGRAGFRARFRAHRHDRATEAQPHLPRTAQGWFQSPSAPDTAKTHAGNTEHQGGSAACSQLPHQPGTSVHLQERVGRTQTPCPAPAHPRGPTAGSARAGGAGRGTRTVFVSCVDVGPQVKQPLEARQPLGLLAGQIEGTALMDLHRAEEKKKNTSKY